MEIKIILPTIKQVEFAIEALPEYIPIKGYAIASGDPEFDAKVENDIAEQLEINIWAWCTVKVTATWKGLEGTDYLGGCSYKSEKDFMENSGYYLGMRGYAYIDLIGQLKHLAE